MNESESTSYEENKGFNVDLLLKYRQVFLFGEIDQTQAEKLCKKLTYLDQESHKPIKLFINSQGGHVEAGDSIHDFIKFVHAPIITIGSGYVASAGTHIYLAAKKENRFSLPNTRFMIHQPSGGGQGRASDLKIQMEQIIEMKERIIKITAEATGQPIERVRKDIDRDYWLTAQEALDYGIVGKIITSRASLCE
ncbi:ATP-dependent Clp protease proteolytic subunit [Candidatus Sororendozoicomonas aggregata]|uniref:ATP-dependent Clp protease proteolytic subunit n=1 Tax=Candidatus Sororendozoicomonas aggregata TaxID=3073239 RepID=UPI002ED2DDDB